MFGKFGAFSVLAASLVAAAYAGPASAATDPGPVPTGSCLIAPAAASPKDVADFMKDPGALLKDLPFGGPEMTRKVRALAGTDPATVAALMDDAKSGSDLAKKAIAGGLGGAALACVKTRSDISLYIQRMAAGLDDKPFIDAFLFATSNVGTAANAFGGATTSGGVGGAVGASLGGNGGGGNGTTNGNVISANSSGSYSAGGGGSVSDTVNPSVSR